MLNSQLFLCLYITCIHTQYLLYEVDKEMLPLCYQGASRIRCINTSEVNKWFDGPWLRVQWTERCVIRFQRKKQSSQSRLMGMWKWPSQRRLVGAGWEKWQMLTQWIPRTSVFSQLGAPILGPERLKGQLQPSQVLTPASWERFLGLHQWHLSSQWEWKAMNWASFSPRTPGAALKTLHSVAGTQLPMAPIIVITGGLLIGHLIKHFIPNLLSSWFRS